MIALTLMRLSLARSLRKLGFLSKDLSALAVITSRRFILGMITLGCISVLVGCSTTLVLTQNRLISNGGYQVIRPILAALAGLMMAPTARMVLDSVNSPQTRTVLARQKVGTLDVIDGAVLVASLYRSGLVASYLISSGLIANTGSLGAGWLMPFRDAALHLGIWAAATAIALKGALRTWAMGTGTVKRWLGALMIALASGAAVGPVLASWKNPDLPGGQGPLTGVAVALLLSGTWWLTLERKRWKNQLWILPTERASQTEPRRPALGAKRSLESIDIAHMVGRLFTMTTSMRNVSILFVWMVACAAGLKLTGQELLLPDPAAAGAIIAFITMTAFISTADAFEAEPDAGPVRLLSRIRGAPRRHWRVRASFALIFTFGSGAVAVAITALAVRDRVPVPPSIVAVCVLWITGVLVVQLVGYRSVSRNLTAGEFEGIPLAPLLAIPGVVLAFGAYAAMIHIELNWVAVPVTLVALSSPWWTTRLIERKL